MVDIDDERRHALKAIGAAGLTLATGTAGCSDVAGTEAERTTPTASAPTANHDIFLEASHDVIDRYLNFEPVSDTVVGMVADPDKYIGAPHASDKGGVYDIGDDEPERVSATGPDSEGLGACTPGVHADEMVSPFLVGEEMKGKGPSLELKYTRKDSDGEITTDLIYEGEIDHEAYGEIDIVDGIYSVLINFPYSEEADGGIIGVTTDNPRDAVGVFFELPKYSTTTKY